MSKHDVFVSYATEDAKAVARPLVKELEARGITVWFAEKKLVAGLSLRKQIDAGLQHSRLGVVVLSRHFFEKEWPQRELNGLTEREMAGEPGVIVPVWHKIDEEDVRRYSAPLAGLFALESRHGIGRVADGIEQALAVKNRGRRRPQRQPQPQPQGGISTETARRIKIAAAVLLALVLALLVAWVVQRGGDETPAADAASSAGSRSSSPPIRSQANKPPSTASKAQQPASLNGLEALGASPNGAPVSPKVEIEVVKFFMPRIGAGAAGQDEFQLKVKLRIVNRSSHTVDVSAGPDSPIVLAVPARGSERSWISSSEPRYRRWRGLLLIPPNPDGEIALEYSAGPGEVGRSYSTHWPFETLPPGGVAFETSYRSGSTVVKRGDLVFSIPHSTYRPGAQMALVYKTPGHQPYFGPGAVPGSWGPPQHPDFF